MEARRAHNPEVVGSSPASATIKTPDFITKSGVFLTFPAEMKYDDVLLTPILTPTQNKVGIVFCIYSKMTEIWLFMYQ